MNILFEDTEPDNSSPVLDLDDATEDKETAKPTPKTKTKNTAKPSAKTTAKSTPKQRKTTVTPSSVSPDRKTFDKIYDAVLKNVDIPSGGVTLQMLRAVKGSNQTQDNLDKITKKTMKDVVYQTIWQERQVSMLPETIQVQFLEMNLAHDAKTAVRILQRAINAATQMPSVTNDGILRKGVASAASRTIARDVDLLKAERCLFYAEEIRKRPNQKQFWIKWFKRAIAN